MALMLPSQALPQLVFPHAPAGIAVAAVQAVGVLTTFSAGGLTPYGRFFDSAKSVGIPSRAGMLALYSPSFIVGVAALSNAIALPPGAGNGREVLLSAMVASHFAKRILESLFVHEYSGDMCRATAGGIGVYYALMSALVLHQQASLPAAVYAAGAGGLRAAVLLFVIGEAGNGWHHWRLAVLRRATQGQGTTGNAASPYVLPTGGLFGAVVSPHYLFEVVAWVGMAVASGHVSSYLLAASMAVYLAGRADATHKWYADKFKEDFPLSRRRIIPGVF